MKKVIKRKSSSNNNTHIKEENEFLTARIIYTPLNNGEFMYSLVIEFKDNNKKLTYDIGSFNMVKAKYSLGKIIIERDIIKIIPLKLNTSVYNLHEKDIKEYSFLI